MDRILSIVGPTASGKTRLAIELAKQLNGEVISCDSMQIYRHMDIGTAKPTAREMDGVPHHMLDMVEPQENYSVARFVEQADACVAQIRARGRVPILAGGTGLYRDALLRGESFAPFTGQYRAQLEAQARAEGTAPLYARLQQVDPQRAALLHPADCKRIVRALEVWLETGETITAHDEKSRLTPPRYEAITLGLAFQERSHMWRRIDARVEEMVDRGLVEEVHALLDRGISPTCTAMQAIGYKELARALAAGTGTEGAIEEIKLRTRQYAKRQLTWFRRDESIHWYLWGENPDFSQAMTWAMGHVAPLLQEVAQ